jgi:starvation-inducible outer membrane lipoprotein
MVGRALKQAVISTFLSFAVAGCTTVPPRLEPAPTTKHPTKHVRSTTAPKVIKRKKVTAKKLAEPVNNEAKPVIKPLGGGGSAGGGSGGW